MSKLFVTQIRQINWKIQKIGFRIWRIPIKDRSAGEKGPPERDEWRKVKENNPIEGKVNLKSQQRYKTIL